jgi:hypothetical protein
MPYHGNGEDLPWPNDKLHGAVFILGFSVQNFYFNKINDGCLKEEANFC